MSRRVLRARAVRAPVLGVALFAGRLLVLLSSCAVLARRVAMLRRRFAVLAAGVAASRRCLVPGARRLASFHRRLMSSLTVRIAVFGRYGLTLGAGFRRIEVVTRYATDAPRGDDEAEARRAELEALIAKAEAAREKHA